MADQIISQANITHLCNICERFFLEKYNINVTQDTLNKTIPVLLNKIIIYYNKNPPLPPLQEINKIAMQRMKDFILSKTQKPSQVQHQQPLLEPLQPPINSQKIPLMPLKDIKYDPNDLFVSNKVSEIHSNHNIINKNDFQEHNEHNEHREHNINNNVNNNTREVQDIVSEDEFFVKLKNLENTRNIIDTVKTNISESSYLSTNTSLNNLVQQQPIVIQQISPSHNLDIHNSFNSITKSIIINAADRDWIYFHERNTFIWSGIQIDASSIKLSHVLMPRRVAKTTPIVILEITGSSNKVLELVLILHTCGVAWDTWKCVNDDLIQNISCPWTLKLLDTHKQPLNILGKDGSIIKSASLLYNKNTQITIEPHMNCIESGTQLKVYNTNLKNNIIMNVINVNGYNIEVEDDVTSSINGIVCNLCYQPYIIIDHIVKVLHK